jgi:hypothetical protein
MVKKIVFFNNVRIFYRKSITKWSKNPQIHILPLAFTFFFSMFAGEIPIFFLDLPPLVGGNGADLAGDLIASWASRIAPKRWRGRMSCDCCEKFEFVYYFQ